MLQVTHYKGKQTSHAAVSLSDAWAEAGPTIVEQFYKSLFFIGHNDAYPMINLAYLASIVTTPDQPLRHEVPLAQLRSGPQDDSVEDDVASHLSDVIEEADAQKWAKKMQSANHACQRAIKNINKIIEVIEAGGEPISLH